MATLYLASGLVYCGYLATERGLFLTLGKSFWGAAFLVHSLFLFSAVIKIGRLPIAGTFETGIFFAWAIVLVSYFSAVQYRIRILGIFVFPLVFFLILVSSFTVHQNVSWARSFPPLYFGLHTVFLFLGYASFALAFATAVMFLVLERQIKWKKIGLFFRRLPSLELLEEANDRFLGEGTLLYTLGIFFGLLWSRKALGFFVGKDPKEIFAFGTWAFCALLFWARHSGRLRGKKGMILSVLFFGWVLVTFLGISHPVVTHLSDSR